MPSVEGAVSGGVGFAMIFGILGTLAGLILGGYLTWTYAPMVGGEWWIYIKVIATIVGAVIGSKIGSLVGYIVGFVAGAGLGWVAT